MDLSEIIKPTLGEWIPRHIFKSKPNSERSEEKPRPAAPADAGRVRTDSEWQHLFLEVVRALYPFPEAREAVVAALDQMAALGLSP